MSHKIDFTTFGQRIQSGTKTGVTFQGTNNVGGGFINITFPTAFPAGTIPKVVCSASVSNGYVASVMVTSVTNTGFTCLCRNGWTGDEQNRSFDWVAVAI